MKTYGARSASRTLFETFLVALALSASVTATPEIRSPGDRARTGP